MQTADSIHAECWKEIDAVVCINLDYREDRWRSFCHAVKGVIPPEKIHRESAVAGAKLPGGGSVPWFTERTSDRSAYWMGTAGCILSHRNVIRKAQQEGWRNVLILEDDVSFGFTSDGLELLHEAIQRFAGRKYLLYTSVGGRSTCARRITQKGDSALMRIGGTLLTHAYLVPAEMYAPLLRALPKNFEDVWRWVAIHRALDTFYCDEVELWFGVSIYAVLPQMCHQLDFRSDIHIGRKFTRRHTRVRILPGWLYGIYRMVRYPYFFLKTRLNSLRTLRRARAGGFPGYRRMT